MTTPPPIPTTDNEIIEKVCRESDNPEWRTSEIKECMRLARAAQKQEDERQIAKTCSSLSKDINRIRKSAQFGHEMNRIRKQQITRYDAFFRELIKEGRITKEELMPYTPRREDVLNRIKGREK